MKYALLFSMALTSCGFFQKEEKAEDEAVWSFPGSPADVVIERSTPAPSECCKCEGEKK